MSTKIQSSIENKVIISRDGSRGWRLTECFIEDACGLLKIEKPELPDVYSDDYSGAIQWECDDLEDQLWSKHYYVCFDDGYLIYKGLTPKELDYMSEHY